MELRDPLIIAGKKYNSRLLVGTGKYKNFDKTQRSMELGYEGVLMNTAIARNPILMANAMKKAVDSGREAFLAGRIEKTPYAMHELRHLKKET